ncbi:hypothetical protein [Marinobacter sp. DS40M6]|uniref:hypothetical protein n=1 Tax=Marinobacter sp. DS40M6 TaxID=1597776 RepID=UPI002358EB64|nr:hypothetical protein [Marinobacter sp. DS40M6]MDC8456905.1 hypothetical protein [Marinobacter sp. DS40M6]
MTDLEKWIEAALTVANTTGMKDSEIIPTWPSDVAGFYPTLTIGALRAWKGKHTEVDSNTEKESTINIPGCKLTMVEALDETFKQVLSDLEKIIGNGHATSSAENPSAERPDGDLIDWAEQTIERLDPNGIGIFAEDLARAGKQLIGATTPQPGDNSLQEVAERVCEHIPENMMISLCMENGAAWVQLGQDKVGNLELPDSADKTLVQQINEALCVANGWVESPQSPEQDGDDD